MVIPFILICLSSWFGFELGRKWDTGRLELETEVSEERIERGGVKLRTITIRR